ncbi:MAG: peroxiredoxin [Casimicrobiaceae bacterium]
MLGQAVQDFCVATSGGTTFVLADHAGKGVVLYFCPKDNTPGCTTEGQQVRDAHDHFLAAGAVIAGVSRDSIKSHESFRTRMAFPFVLSADADERLGEQFGVIKAKNMSGKVMRGIERSTFLIERNGILAREWRGVQVSGRVQDVLAAVQAVPRA